MNNDFIDTYVKGILAGTALKFRLIRGGFQLSLGVFVVLFIGVLGMPIALIVGLGFIDSVLGLNLWKGLKNWLTDKASDPIGVQNDN